ncbi:hypothetical protein F8388_008085, partial [Cannabis sativa]
MKIINSVVVISTTFSIGRSYLFLLRARVLEEGEEGTKKKVSTTTRFITRQLMMFISIYYVPLHLALGRPQTITVLALPYLLLVNIYMFRCNNKMLFVTSSFVGWLIGHILFMKWVGLVLVWIQHNNSIRSNVLIRSNKYLVAELRNFMARIFSILLFITCIYYLGRIPSP